MISYVNVTELLDALRKAQSAAPTIQDHVEDFLGALFAEAIEPLREWIFQVECAVDEVERTAEQLFDAGPSDRPAVHADMATCLGCVLDELELIRAT